jgi:hypothetical protein
MGLFWCKAIRVRRWWRAPLPHTTLPSVRTGDLGRKLRGRTPQLTPGGFHDSKTHGTIEHYLNALVNLHRHLEGHLGGVSHSLGFFDLVEPSEISVRTTYVDRTKQVASDILTGVDPSIIPHEWAAYGEPEEECHVVEDIIFNH